MKKGLDPADNYIVIELFHRIVGNVRWQYVSSNTIQKKILISFWENGM